MASLFLGTTFHATGTDGRDLAGGKVFTYAAGTLVPLATYTDQTAATTNTNPVILNANGRADIWLGTAAYRFIIQDASGVAAPDGDKDNIQGSATAADFAASSGSALVGFIQSGAGAVKRLLQSELRDAIKPQQFGAVGDDSTDDISAFNAAATAAAASGKAISIPAGTYKLGSSWALSTQAFRVVPLGKVTLHFTGAGQGLILDGTPAGGSGIYGAIFGGDTPIYLKGNAATTDICFVRAIHHSLINIDVKDGITGCRVNFAVCTDFRVECSNNTSSFVTTPVNGMILDIRGAGEYVAACNIHPVIEGVSSTGIVGVSAGFNNIRGGTVESCGKGVTWSSSCFSNAIHGTDFEMNTVSDVEDNGNSNKYHEVQFASGAVSAGNFVPGAACTGAQLYGGYCRWPQLTAGSVGTGFFGVSVASTVGILGTGTYESFNSYLVNASRAVVSKITDQIGESGQTWTPAFTSVGGGTQGTVTNAVGSYSRIGKNILVNATMTIAKGTLGAGAISVSGLPFGGRVLAGIQQYVHCGEWTNITLGASYTDVSGRLSSGASALTLIKSGTANASAVVNLADFADPMVLNFSGVYEAA